MSLVFAIATESETGGWKVLNLSRHILEQASILCCDDSFQYQILPSENRPLHVCVKGGSWFRSNTPHGANMLTSFAHIVSRYRAFQLYYFGFFAVLLVICAFNGFVLLPVILRFLGPPSIFNNTASGVAASAPADLADKPTHVELEGGKKAPPPVGSALER